MNASYIWIYKSYILEQWSLHKYKRLWDVWDKD